MHQHLASRWVKDLGVNSGDLYLNAVPSRCPASIAADDAQSCRQLQRLPFLDEAGLFKNPFLVQREFKTELLAGCCHVNPHVTTLATNSRCLGMHQRSSKAERAPDPPAAAQ